MVSRGAIQMLKKSEDLKEKILTYKNGTSLLADKNMWVAQQQLQKLYQTLLIMDLDFALEKNVEQDLWTVGFKQQIEALQLISKDRKNPLRSESQSMLSVVLQAAAGFYLALLHEICTTFQLDLPFRRRISLLGCIENWKPNTCNNPAPQAAKYICQHCLVHLGDLARYRHDVNIAHTFYRHAVLVSASSGQPYNQLALVAWRKGDRLTAVYLHVRSILVAAPFPPAAANLSRTLAAAASTQPPEALSDNDDNVLVPKSGVVAAMAPNIFVYNLIRFYHFIHSLDDLDEASIILEKLSESIVVLVANESFDAMTHIKMACLAIWAVTKDEDVEEAAIAINLATRVFYMHFRSLMLCCEANHRYPAIKVYLDFLVNDDKMLKKASSSARPEIWSALSKEANTLQESLEGFDYNTYSNIILPEDQELNGFLPIEDKSAPSLDCDSNVDDTIAKKIRAVRILRLIERISGSYPELLTCSVIEDKKIFESKLSLEELENLFKLELSIKSRKTLQLENPKVEANTKVHDPTVISIAHFKQKVREKPIGILKPQGSLEKWKEVREKRDLDKTSEDEVKEESKDLETSTEEGRRKKRMNVAMAAILKKQEESNKQVKFAASSGAQEAESTETVEEEKPKSIQTKSLDNLPTDRRTGGILSLKDKSAGYPHLVKTEPEVVIEVDEKKIPPVKTTQSQHSQSQKNQNVKKIQQGNNEVKRHEGYIRSHYNHGPIYNQNKPINPMMPPNLAHPQMQMSTNVPNIRLPVVNPKEIDVRNATLLRTSSDQFTDSKTSPNWPMSNDKKAFLNDLPPRFANQFNRNNNWGNDQQYARDNNQRFPNSNPEWMNEPQMQHFTNTFNQPYPAPLQPNFYQNPPPNYVANPYRSASAFNQFQQPPPPSFLNDTSFPGPHNQPTLQSLVNSTNFGNSMSSYVTYGQNMTYDATMYPQFSNVYQSPAVVPTAATAPKLNDACSSYSVQSKGSSLDMGFGVGDQRTSELMAGVLGKDNLNIIKKLEQPQDKSYSLFSGDREVPVQHFPAPTSSLWSGPGPSPLERLLEQQKRIKQDPR